jgi:TrmH family RNA methyltransferase
VIGAALGPRHHEVKRVRALLTDRRARDAEQAFVVEGPRGVASAFDHDAALEVVYFGPNAHVAFADLRARLDAAGVPWRELKEGVLERVGSTVTPQPVLAIARKPAADPTALARRGLVLLGDELADPGNVGTLLRSAEASGAAAIVLGAGSVDAYNPKVVRASAGAIFGVPVMEEWSAVEALDALGELGRQRLGAVAGSGTPYMQVDFTAPTAVVVGNEAHGLSPAVVERLDGEVTIPIAASSESLNVAMAATVLCFESARQLAEVSS